MFSEHMEKEHGEKNLNDRRNITSLCFVTMLCMMDTSTDSYKKKEERVIRSSFVFG